VALDPEAELGRLIEPMLPPLLLLEKPLEEVEEEDLPPSTESSSSKFLSVGEHKKFINVSSNMFTAVLSIKKTGHHQSANHQKYVLAIELWFV